MTNTPEVVHVQTGHHSLWLSDSVSQVHSLKCNQEEFKERWADQYKVTYRECSLLAQATAAGLAAHYGDVVDSTMPSMCFLSAHFVDHVEPEVHISDSGPQGLIHMIRRTDLNFH